MRQTYNSQPDVISEIRSTGIITTVFRIDITQTEDGYECDEVEYNHREPLTEDDYGPMVTALIRLRYSADEMEALLNNYVASKTTEHKAEWNTMQAWRTEAKRLARLALDGI